MKYQKAVAMGVLILAWLPLIALAQEASPAKRARFIAGKLEREVGRQTPVRIVSAEETKNLSHNLKGDLRSRPVARSGDRPQHVGSRSVARSGDRPQRDFGIGSKQEGSPDAPEEQIPWSVLAPASGRPFQDPFSKLTSNQLADLSYVARVQRLISEEKIAADGADAKEAAELARKLEEQGVDIGWLLVQRERVRQIRGLQVESLSKSIARSLQDKRVALTGYVIPIKVDEGQLTEFFLVPTIAACSHEDPPPRLQVVFVATEQGIATPGRRTPVRVTGKIVAEASTSTTFNGNGRVHVHSAYAMSSPEIRVFQATRRSSNPPKQ